MKFQYQLVPDDYGAFATHTFGGARASAQVGKSRWALAVVAAAYLLFKLASGASPSVADIVFPVIALAWAAVLPRVFQRSVAKRMRTMARSGLSKGAVGHQELTLDDEGLTQRTPFGAVQRTWQGIERVDETPDHLFVYYGPQAAFIVPKSWLGESAASLRTAIEKSLSSCLP